MCGLRNMLGNSLLFACYSNPPGPQARSPELWPQHPTPTAEGCLLHCLRSWCHETGHQGDSRSPGDTRLSILMASFPTVTLLLMNDFLREKCPQGARMGTVTEIWCWRWGGMWGGNGIQHSPGHSSKLQDLWLPLPRKLLDAPHRP